MLILTKDETSHHAPKSDTFDYEKVTSKTEVSDPSFQENVQQKAFGDDVNLYSCSFPCSSSEKLAPPSSSSSPLQHCLPSANFTLNKPSLLDTHNVSLSHGECSSENLSQANSLCTEDAVAQSSFTFLLNQENQQSLHCDSKPHLKRSLFKNHNVPLDCSGESVLPSSLIEASESNNKENLYTDHESQQNNFISEYPMTTPTSNDGKNISDGLSLPVSTFKESHRTGFAETLSTGHKCTTSMDSVDYSQRRCLGTQDYPNEINTGKDSQNDLLGSSCVTHQHSYDSLEPHPIPMLSQSSLYTKGNSTPVCRPNLQQNIVEFAPQTFLVPQNNSLNSSVYSYQRYGSSFPLSSSNASNDSLVQSNRDSLLCNPFLSEFCNGTSNMSFLVSPERFSNSKQLISVNRSHDTPHPRSPPNSKPFISSQPVPVSQAADVVRTTNVVPVVAKRPRGRPRKHAVVENGPKTTEEEDQTSTASPHINNAANSNVVEGSVGFSKTSNEDPHLISHAPLKPSVKALGSADLLRKYALRCIECLRALQATYYKQKLREIESVSPHDEISEEYLALGGPYTPLALALEVQQQQNMVSHKTCDYVSLRKASADIVQQCSRETQQLIINLNSSFVWSSLEYKIPVRDIAASRYHLVALLNDSRVFVYRHKTHPLVTSRVNQWEHVEALDHCGIVAVRITSANLSGDWREKYHAVKRLEFIKQIRQKLRASNIILPSNNPFPSDDVTLEELRLFVEHHPLGILCCPTSSLDPDWLPEPFVIAALDRAGVVRLAKCCGFYNYPIVIKTSLQSPLNSSASYQSQKINRVNRESTSYSTFSEPQVIHRDTGFQSSAFDPLSLIHRHDDENHKDLSQNQFLSVTKNLVHVDLVEKQLQLSVPTNETTKDGEVVKSFAKVQEIGLAELTEESLISSSGANPEVAMILYALANKEHSAFVKGKNLYIRFKNFPTGPIKIYCGPLGHCGAVLLANGTVWTWTAQAKGPGSSKGKLGVLIHQVKGSLEGKSVIDMTALGADFLALTSDGVVHEWNSYAPYISMRRETFEMTVPQSLSRPSIPEPIELTPSFQKKLMSQRSHKNFIYKVGSFSWGMPQQCRQAKTEDPTHSSLGEFVAQNEKVHFANEDNQNFKLPESQAVNWVTRETDNESNTFKSEMNNQLVDNNNHLFDSFMPPPLRPDTYNYLLSSEFSFGLTPLESSHNTTSEVEDADGWRLSDYASEEALEKHRQDEIRWRYSGVLDMNSNSLDLIERIFLFEGATLFLKSRSAQYSFILNDFASYRSEQGSRWCDVYSSIGEKSFVQKHAECFIRVFGSLGKPLITNPIVLARLKVSHAEEQLDEQVRQQLKAMADTRPPVYRLLYSPISLLVCILCHYDFATEARQRLNYSLPVPVAAYNPSLFLEAFSGVPLNNLQLPTPRSTYSTVVHSGINDIFNSKYCHSTDEDLDEIIQPFAYRKDIQKRGRGRVGRPRGSRSAFRTSLLQQRHTQTFPKRSKSFNEIGSDSKRDDMLNGCQISTRSKQKVDLEKTDNVQGLEDSMHRKDQSVCSSATNLCPSNDKNSQLIDATQTNSFARCVRKRSRCDSTWETSNQYYMFNEHEVVYPPWDNLMGSLKTGKDNTSQLHQVLENDGRVHEGEHKSEQRLMILNQHDSGQATVHEGSTSLQGYDETLDSICHHSACSLREVPQGTPETVSDQLIPLK